MRKWTPNWRGYLGIPVCVLVIIIATGGTLSADSPVFTIDNSYERVEDYILGSEIVTETYQQSYTLNWSETFTERLQLNFQFDLPIVDNIKSNDVDNKEYSPTIDLELNHFLWDLKYTLEDVFEETNELGAERTEALNISADVSLAIPGIDVTYDVVVDDQENLEDSVEKKLDIAMEYTLWPELSFDTAFQTGKFDDFLNDNSDTDSFQWDIGISYSSLLTSSLKLNLDTSWDREVVDTLNNAGVVLSTEESKGLETKLQLTLDGFPELKSDFELSSSKAYIEDTEKVEVTFNIESTQHFLALGDLTETLDVSVNDSKGTLPQENVLESGLTLGAKLTGAPSQWIDYSVEEKLEFSDSQFEVSSQDTDTKNSAFDLSITLLPINGWTWDTAFNWTVDWEKGIRIGEEKIFKIEMTLEGETFNVPNLTFNPSLNFSNEEDQEAGITTTSTTYNLDFTYTLILPKSFTLNLEPSYSWEKANDGQETESIAIAYKAGWHYEWSEWSLSLDVNGDYDDTLDDNVVRVITNDLDFQASTILFGNLEFDLQYQYSISSDADSEASVELSLEWELYNMNFSLSADGSRTFNAEKTESRTYLAEFFMEF